MCSKIKNITKKYLEQEYTINKNSAKKIAEQLECSVDVIWNRLTKYNIDKHNKPLEIYIGKQYNYLTVISVVRINTGKYKNEKHLKCQCKCGKIVLAPNNKLRSGKIKSCGCLRNKQNTQRFWKGEGELSGSYFSSMKKTARKRNIDFNITIEELWNKFIEQKRICSLSGQKLTLVKVCSDGKLKQTASVDRIDSGFGYTVDNVQWVHKNINKIKINLDEKRFVELCHLVANFDSIFPEIKFVVKNRSLSWRGCGNISGNYWYNIKRRALSKNIKFNITIQQTWKLYLNQGGICALTGLPIKFESDSKHYTEKTASLDRIDSSKGYVKGNIQFLHKTINNMKWGLDQDYFIKTCKKISKYNKDND